MKLKEQSGQMIVESVLIMTMLVGFAYFISGYISKNNVLARLVSSPWANLSGVIQNGTWAAPNASMKQHPNNTENKISLRGDTP